MFNSKSSIDCLGLKLQYFNFLVVINWHSRVKPSLNLYFAGLIKSACLQQSEAFLGN